jgi:hypothetical protein
MYTMNIWMDRLEERLMVKDFFLKGDGSKLIHKEHVNTFQGQCDCIVRREELTQVIQIRQAFLQRRRRPGRTLIYMSPALWRFLK